MVISIGNNKGGVGKTSVTCNLAVALARRGKKVLTVDNDPQSNLTSILMGEIQPTTTLYELISPESHTRIQDCIYPTEEPGLYCLPNIEDTAALELYLCREAKESISIYRRKIRDFATANYDFTLIDNPPTIGLWLSISLAASDFAIVPVDAGSVHSIEGLERVLELINAIRVSYNPQLRFLRLLINKVDARTLVSKRIQQLIWTRFPDDTFVTYIPMNTVVQQAEYIGVPAIKFDPSCRAARRYRELAAEILTILKMEQR
ncbi:MAG: ParA family protein [Candidatus Methanomethylicaceae archaeon]